MTFSATAPTNSIVFYPTVITGTSCNTFISSTVWSANTLFAGCTTSSANNVTKWYPPPQTAANSALEFLAHCAPQQFNKFIFELVKKRWNVSYDTDPIDDDEATVILNDSADIFIEKIHLTEPDFTLPAGVYNLPGGAKLIIDTNKSYRIDDRNHKTTYKANPEREFNRYLNVSDVLEKFIKYIAKLNLTQTEFMELPLRLFIWWLVIEAAELDQELPPEDIVVQLETALTLYQKETVA